MRSPREEVRVQKRFRTEPEDTATFIGWKEQKDQKGATNIKGRKRIAKGNASSSGLAN